MSFTSSRIVRTLTAATALGALAVLPMATSASAAAKPHHKQRCTSSTEHSKTRDSRGGITFTSGAKESCRAVGHSTIRI